MSYQEKYRQKLVSAAQAASVIKSGDWVDYIPRGRQRACEAHA